MSATPILRTDGLVKRFGGLLATDHVDIDVVPGEVHALIGPNGAGKTTLITLLSGEMRPDAGSVMLDGRAVTRSLLPDHPGPDGVHGAGQRAGQHPRA